MPTPLSLLNILYRRLKNDPVVALRREFEQTINNNIASLVDSDEINECQSVATTCEDYSTELHTYPTYRKFIFEKLEDLYSSNLLDSDDITNNFGSPAEPDTYVFFQKDRGSKYDVFNTILLSHVDEFQKYAPSLFLKLKGMAAYSLDWAIALLENTAIQFSSAELEAIAKKFPYKKTSEKFAVFCGLALLRTVSNNEKSNELFSLLTQENSIRLIQFVKSSHTKKVPWSENQIHEILPMCYDNAELFLEVIKNSTIVNYLEYCRKNATDLTLAPKRIIPSTTHQDNLITASAQLQKAMQNILIPWPSREQVFIKNVVNALKSSSNAKLSIQIGFQKYAFNSKELLLLIRSNDTLCQLFKKELDKKSWRSKIFTEPTGLDKLTHWMKEDGIVAQSLFQETTINYLEKAKSWFPLIERKPTLSSLAAVSPLLIQKTPEPYDTPTNTSRSTTPDSNNHFEETLNSTVLQNFLRQHLLNQQTTMASANFRPNHPEIAQAKLMTNEII